jgi:putative transposase
LVAELLARYRVSRRQVCRALRFPRATDYYRSRKDPQDALRIRLRDLAAVRVRYGYRRLHILLRREGWAVNRKRVYRLYKLESLGLRRKSPRRRASPRTRDARPPVTAANQVWAMDFVTVTLADGRRVRTLAVLDLFTRESLAIRSDHHFPAGQVVAVLDELVAVRGSPGAVRVDNGPEFAGKTLDLWAYFRRVVLDFSRPGTPTDNAFIESFNGRLRDECLNPNWFLCLDEVRRKTEDWRREYNRERPHSALGNLAPEEFAAQMASPTRPNQN